MKLNMTNIDENHLSSDVVSIESVYFWSQLHWSLKYAIRFFSINTPQDHLQGVIKLTCISHVNPFAFFFHCRKQIEVIGSQIRRIGWVGMACRAWHVLGGNSLTPDLCELDNYWDEPPVIFDVAFFLAAKLPVQMEWLNLSQNNRCSFWYHLGVCWQHGSRSDSIWLQIWTVNLNIKSRLCDDFVSRQNLHATWWYIQRKLWLITRHEVMPIITFDSMQEWQRRFCLLLSFFAQIMHRQTQRPI
jgi:hypothetical protein